MVPKLKETCALGYPLEYIPLFDRFWYLSAENGDPKNDSNNKHHRSEQFIYHTTHLLGRRDDPIPTAVKLVLKNGEFWTSDGAEVCQKIYTPISMTKKRSFTNARVLFVFTGGQRNFYGRGYKVSEAATLCAKSKYPGLLRAFHTCLCLPHLYQ